MSLKHNLTRNSLFLFLVVSCLYANKANTFILYKYLTLKEKDFKVSPKIVMALIKTESNFEKNIILINSYKKNTLAIFNFLKNKGYKVKKSKHYISVVPTDEKRLSVLNFVHFLKMKKYIKTYDIGLMQINEKNLASFEEQKKYYLDSKKNIKFGVNILYNCFKKYKNSYKGYLKTFECYNKGYQDEKFNGNYYKRFLNNYAYIRTKQYAK